jgi:hypothetical protein
MHVRMAMMYWGLSNIAGNKKNFIIADHRTCLNLRGNLIPSTPLIAKATQYFIKINNRLFSRPAGNTEAPTTLENKSALMSYFQMLCH